MCMTLHFVRLLRLNRLTATHTLLLSRKHGLAFITVCFVFYSTSTKALLDMNANDELTARVAKMVALLNLRHCLSQSCSKTK